MTVDQLTVLKELPLSVAAIFLIVIVLRFLQSRDARFEAAINAVAEAMRMIGSRLDQHDDRAQDLQIALEEKDRANIERMARFEKPLTETVRVVHRIEQKLDEHHQSVRDRHE